MKKILLFLFVCYNIINGYGQACNGFENYPEGEEAAKKLHVLYRDLIDSEKYDEAFPMWEKLMKYSAAGHVYHFIDGITMYEYFLNREKADEAKAEIYRQNIVDLYEQRLKCMSPERGDSNIVMESFAYHLSAIGYDNANKTLTTFRKAVQMNGNNTSAYILAYYADYAIFMYGNDLISKAEVVKIYQQLEKIKDANIDNSDYSNNWRYVEEYYEPINTVEYFGCEFFADRLKSEYEANPDDPEVFRAILRELLIKGCDRSNTFVNELMVKDSAYINICTLTVKIKETYPGQWGKKLLSEGKADEAIPYFEKTLTMDISQEELVEANFNLARIYHSKGGSINYELAREYYETAAKLKPNWGEPYMEIGKLYASSVLMCEKEDKFKQKIIVQAAVDMWEKAKRIDKATEESADNLISKYIKSIPTKGEIEKRGFQKGDSITIDCWVKRDIILK